MSAIPKIIKAWCSNISVRNPESQLSFYSDDAILLPTYDTICVGSGAILDYFNDFLDKDELECNITKNYTQYDIDRDILIASGLYTFSFFENGEYKKVDARYTFVVAGNRIVNHHSSVEPLD